MFVCWLFFAFVIFFLLFFFVCLFFLLFSFLLLFWVSWLFICLFFFLFLEESGRESLFVFGGEWKGESFCFALGWYIFYILWFLYLYTVCWTSCFNSIKIKKKMYLLFLIFIIFCIHLNNNLQHCTNMYNNTINILKKIYCN